LLPSEGRLTARLSFVYFQVSNRDHGSTRNIRHESTDYRTLDGHGH
jgi:hypothetical protein